MPQVSQEPAVTAIARSRGTRRGAAGTALLVLAADQASKSLVMTASPAGDGGGPVSVRLAHNSGASFGIGAGNPW
jgi:lipoprotein signal peptidase